MLTKRRSPYIAIGVFAIILIVISAFYLLSNMGSNKTADRQKNTSSQQDMPGMPGMKAEGNQNSAPKASEAPAGHQHGIPQTSQPIEGMTEVPTIEVPTDKQQLIGVRTVTVDMKTVTKTIRATGRIEYNEQKRYVVNSRFEGWLERLNANFTGKYIRRGDPIAEIYSPELLSAQQEYLNLLKWQPQSSPSSNTYSDKIDSMITNDTQSVLQAAKQKLRLLDISDSQIEEIARTGVPRRTLTLFSPVSGYIAGKNMYQGQKFMAGETIVELADLSTVWLVADIYADSIPDIRVGQMAAIDLIYFPGRIYNSSIDYVYPTLAQDTRTLKVRFTIPNPDMQLKPQMYCDVTLKVTLGSKLVVPEEAVIDSGTTQLVYVDKGQGIFEPRKVIPGVKSDGMVEILEGLKVGDKVVDHATFLLDSEARLKGVVQ
ncbi:MAG TPA: efflux transporter periplasmic adaptor subunit [Candidatus Margulisbacteria bacterium]|nr:MAG: hypothetical protein A2X43_10125 [Candidatus Margulisbacteria bacterium GWD2_39_127]HAR64410.1 efflux transporter periplasmic adaptor subunit [Candidatus Margulisiibacteriota bacterium]